LKAFERTSRLGAAWAFCLLVTGTASAQNAGSFESGFITASDGAGLHYLEAGSGPAIVFVPGWTMPAEIWEEQLAYFSRTHRVVALDPRSQGRSEKVADGHYPERRARDVFELIEALELAPAVLVGWSLAVPELLTYVEQFGTESIRALVLVDGFIGADRDPCGPNPLAGMLRALHTNRTEYTKDFVRSMYGTPRSEEYLRRITEASLETPTNTAFTLLAHLMVTGGDWRGALDGVDRPLLYIVTPQLAGQAEMVRARLPHARVELFENAGHALFVDEADRFNALLQGLLGAS
jgi:non-heme chloroperoxidase